LVQALFEVLDLLRVLLVEELVLEGLATLVEGALFAHRRGPYTETSSRRCHRVSVAVDTCGWYARVSMRARRVVLCLALTVASGACATAGGHGGPADARQGDDVDAPEPDAPAPDIDAPDRADAPPGTPDASADAAIPDA